LRPFKFSLLLSAPFLLDHLYFSVQLFFSFTKTFQCACLNRFALYRLSLSGGADWLFNQGICFSAFNLSDLVTVKNFNLWHGFYNFQSVIWFFSKWVPKQIELLQEGKLG
jgi:hypothetical protein